MNELGTLRLERWVNLNESMRQKSLLTLTSCSNALQEYQGHSSDMNETGASHISEVAISSMFNNILMHNISQMKELLQYTCDSCSPDVEHAVRDLWDNGLCEPPPHTTFNCIVYFSYIIILLAALFGNTLVVYIVGGTAKMRTVTNYFIVNLAIGDLCTAIFCIPFTFLPLILQYWPFGQFLCVTVNYLQGVTIFVSAYSLVAISIDRYLAIIYPLRPRMTRLQARVIIWLVWVLALLTTAPLAMFSHLMQPEENRYLVLGLKVCVENWGEDSVQTQASYSATLMLLQYFLPVTVLVFTYTRIGLVVWGKKTLGETPARNDRIARSKRKLIKMMVVVVAVYTLCWLPFNVLMVLRSLDERLDQWAGMMYLWTSFHWLAMSHTCYNPVILCWMNNKFRSGFCYVGYHVPCLRRFLDSCFGSSQEEELLRATTFTSAPNSRLSSRLIVTISLKDDSIVFKSRHCNDNATQELNSYRNQHGPNKFLYAMEDTSSESRL